MRIDWNEGRWTHEPPQVRSDGGAIVVEAAEGSDAWRETSYGFVHASEHALVRPWPTDTAVEVSFVCDLPEQFDQAGVFLRLDDEHWVKAGVERSDGVLQLGAVVTWPRSDWSVAPVPQWDGEVVTIRASRTGNAVTLRARAGEGDWQFVRVFPVPEEAALEAGPMVCAPTRAGLEVRFEGWRADVADASLH